MQKITVVIPTRNDDFGGNHIETAAATLQTMSNTYDEVILVDFGSAEALFPILNSYIEEKTGNIRVVTVPQKWVLEHLDDDKTFTDTWARNIGIRRASNDIIVSSNIDIIPAPLDCFEFEKYEENILYTSPKFMAEQAMIITWRNEGLSWTDIQYRLFNEHRGYVRQGLWTEDPWSKISGPGDFQLAHRNIWFHDEVRGFEESLIYKDYSDTNLHKKIIENSPYDVCPAPFFYIFHQSHIDNRGSSKANDRAASTIGFMHTTNPSTWGFSEEVFEEGVI